MFLTKSWHHEKRSIFINIPPFTEKVLKALLLKNGIWIEAIWDKMAFSFRGFRYWSNIGEAILKIAMVQSYWINHWHRFSFFRILFLFSGHFFWPCLSEMYALILKTIKSKNILSIDYNSINFLFIKVYIFVFAQNYANRIQITNTQDWVQPWES